MSNQQGPDKGALQPTWPTGSDAERGKGPLPSSPVLSALILAQIALRRWTELYARLQNESGEVVSRKLDYNLPPAEHVKALEAVAEALEHVKAVPSTARSHGAAPIKQCPDGQKCANTETGQCWGSCVRQSFAQRSSIGTPTDAGVWGGNADGLTALLEQNKSLTSRLACMTDRWKLQCDDAENARLELAELKRRSASATSIDLRNDDLRELPDFQLRRLHARVLAEFNYRALATTDGGHDVPSK